MRSVLVIAGVVLALGAGIWFYLDSTAKIDDTPPLPSFVERDANMHALLVGCTQYPKLLETHGREEYDGREIELEGPAHDVELLHETLRDYLGVPDENITVLKGWPDAEAQRPTRKNILSHLTRLAKTVKPGDRVVFHFAGHGFTHHDTGEIDELDGREEILLPADVTMWHGRGPVPGSIRDDDLWAHATAIRDAGATVWLSLDCCNSGGGMRGVSVRKRSLEPEDLGVEEPAARPHSISVAVQNEDRRGIVALTAAQSDQIAPEMMLPDGKQYRNRRTHGLYTFLLARTLQKYGGRLTFAELHEHLLIGYQSLPWEGASPSIDGARDLRVSDRQRPGGPPLWLRRTGKTLHLNAGSIRGLSKGTILDVYRPGQRDKADGRLGRIEIVEAELTRSICVPVREDPFDPSAVANVPLPARIRTVAVGDVTMPLAVVDASGAHVAEADLPAHVRRTFEDEIHDKRFPRVPPRQAQWLLHVGGERLLLERVGAGFESPRLIADDLPDALFRIFRARCLRRLARGDILGTLPKGLEVRAYVADSKRAARTAVNPGMPSEPGARVPLVPGVTLTPGVWIALEVQNLTSKDVDLTVLMLDANYGTEPLFPHSGRAARLDNGENRVQSLGPWPLLDDAFGAESLLMLAVPCTDQDPITQFTDLGQEPLPTSRGLEAPDFVRDLLSSDGQTRSGTTLNPESIRIRALPWRTHWPELHIPSEIKEKGIATPQVTGALATSDVSPWFLGTQMAVLVDARPRQDRERPADAILTWNDATEQVYVSHGDGYADRTPAELAQQIAEGTLKADLAMRFQLDRRHRAVWYPNRDGVFDLRLVDSAGDPRADERYDLKAGTWQASPSREPWLATSKVQIYDKRAAFRSRYALILRLRRLVRHP